MTDALLTLLKWCLLALMYLFFFRVLQATWMAAAGPKKVMRGTASVEAKGPEAPPVGTRLVVTEPAEMSGRTFVIGSELTIGRSAGATVTMDDTYISQMHARVTHGEGGVVLEDLGSTNGTYLNRQRVASPVLMVVGDRLQLGGVVMELQP